MQPTLPQGVTHRPDPDPGRGDHRPARTSCCATGCMGLALVVLLLFLFLNARTAFWVAMGIPVSMTATIALMYVFGHLDQHDLALRADHHHRDHRRRCHRGRRARRFPRPRARREPPMEAAENAARRMFAPVFSSTATTVIAFLGLVAIGGRFGVGDLRHPVHRDRGADRLAGGMLPDPAEPHGPCAGPCRPSSTGTTGRSRIVNRGFGWVRDRLVRPLMAVVIWARYPVLAAAVLPAGRSRRRSSCAATCSGGSSTRPSSRRSRATSRCCRAATRDDTMAQMRELQRATEAIGARYEAQYGLQPAAPT